MATITILDSNSGNGPLQLSDNGRTSASRKETIIWKLGNNSGVESIKDIRLKTSPPSPNIFSEMPHRDGSSGNWKAKVHEKAKIGDESSYSIFWIPKGGNGKPKEHDPKIAVRPDPITPFAIIAITMSALVVFAFAGWLLKEKREQH